MTETFFTLLTLCVGNPTVLNDFCFGSFWFHTGAWGKYRPVGTITRVYIAVRSTNSRPKRTSLLVPIFAKKDILSMGGANSRNAGKGVIFQTKVHGNLKPGKDFACICLSSSGFSFCPSIELVIKSSNIKNHVSLKKRVVVLDFNISDFGWKGVFFLVQNLYEHDVPFGQKCVCVSNYRCRQWSKCVCQIIDVVNDQNVCVKL